MKGTITIKAFEVNENETQLGVYADIRCCGLEDKIRIVHGVMDALEFTRSEKRLLSLSLAINATDIGIETQQLIRGEGARADFEKWGQKHDS